MPVIRILNKDVGYKLISVVPFQNVASQLLGLGQSVVPVLISLIIDQLVTRV